MIDKLELLLALAKERHFGRAAEACGVTQPTMSTSLKQLEPEGERTLDWARRIVGDTRAMKQEINSLKHSLSGEIRIAASRISPESLSLRLLISCRIARVSPTIRRAQSSVRSPSGVKP